MPLLSFAGDGKLVSFRNFGFFFLVMGTKHPHPPPGREAAGAGPPPRPNHSRCKTVDDLRSSNLGRPADGDKDTGFKTIMQLSIM